MGERRAAGALRQTEKCSNIWSKERDQEKQRKGFFFLSGGDKYFHSPKFKFISVDDTCVIEIHSKWLDLMEKRICCSKALSSKEDFAGRNNSLYEHRILVKSTKPKSKHHIRRSLVWWKTLQQETA